MWSGRAKSVGGDGVGGILKDRGYGEVYKGLYDNSNEDSEGPNNKNLANGV